MIPGAKPYSESKTVATSLSEFRVICAGNVAAKWLAEILPTGHIVDIQDSTTFVHPEEPISTISTWCGYQHKNFRYCSLTKLWTLVYFLKFSGEI